ncbi:MAG TPA: Wzz/FepE/Etk N-terminal domain-containing protein, partial [Panacibacter sp.]|nr:Wzz/FepE/Etk N-terminal domain-containing protein [Panacibacter sp.]
METNNTGMQGQQDDIESGLDLKKIIFTIFSYWHWYFISLIIGFLLAFVYLYFATPMYKIHASLLVENAQSSNSSTTSLLDETSLLSDLGLSNVTNSVDNEMAILESHSLMDNIVRGLQLNVRYFGATGIKSVEIPISRSPFEFRIDSLTNIPVNLPINFVVKLNGDTFDISDKDSSFKIPFGGKLRLKGSVFTVLPKPLSNPGDTLLHSYSVNIISFEQAISNYLGNLGIINTNSKAATISLTLNEEPLPKRGIEMLTNLINTYIRLNIEDKNRVADSTIAFINNRLFLVSDELNSIEKQIQNFKQANKLTDLTTEAQLLVTNTSDYLKNLAVQQTELEMANALDNYLKDEKTNKRVVPTNLSLQSDPNF